MSRTSTRIRPSGRGCRVRASGAGLVGLEGCGHTDKTLMVELGTPATLMGTQMGHGDGSVQARYALITSGMSGRLLDGLTEPGTGCSGRAARVQFEIAGRRPRSSAGGEACMIVSRATRLSPRFSPAGRGMTIGLRPARDEDTDLGSTLERVCYSDEWSTTGGAGSWLAIPTSAQALLTRCRPSGPKRASAFCTVSVAKSVKLASFDRVGSVSASYQT